MFILTLTGSRPEFFYTTETTGQEFCFITSGVGPQDARSACTGRAFILFFTFFFQHLVDPEWED
jgi:hypothetical protein